MTHSGDSDPYASLREGLVSSAAFPPGRQVWAFDPPTDAPTRAIIFLDAELYIERVGAVELLQPFDDTVALFVSYHSREARHTDFICNDAYTDFVRHDVYPWLRARYPTIDPTRVTLAGLSLSGLAAAYAAVRHPTLFARVICQSPSFWWKDEHFRQILPRGSAPQPEFWISVGDRETDRDVSHAPSGMFQRFTQIESCQRTSEAMQALGYPVQFRIFQGGHDPACWNDDLKRALL